MKLIKNYIIVVRCSISLLCIYAVIQSGFGPSGFSDKSHLIIIPFGVVTSICVFIERLGVLRIHAVWLLLSAVAVQQVARELEYERFRAEAYKQRVDDLLKVNHTSQP